MKHILQTLLAGLLVLTVLSGCDKRMSYTNTGEKVYGNITLLTETLYEAEEGQSGIGRGKKINYRNMYFDQEGKLTETVHYWKHQVMQREIFSYAADGRLGGGEVYGFEGAMLGNYTYAYGVDGRVAEQLLTAKDGKVLWKNTYVYDADGNVAELTTIDADGTVTARTETAYDAQGFPIETKTFGHENRLVKVTNHTYDSTDKHGNWIRRINMKEGKVASLIEREITY